MIIFFFLGGGGGGGGGALHTICYVIPEIKEKGGIGNAIQNVCAHVMRINTRHVIA